MVEGCRPRTSLWVLQFSVDSDGCTSPRNKVFALFVFHVHNPLPFNTTTSCFQPHDIQTCLGLRFAITLLVSRRARTPTCIPPPTVHAFMAQHSFRMRCPNHFQLPSRTSRSCVHIAAYQHPAVLRTEKFRANIRKGMIVGKEKIRNVY